MIISVTKLKSKQNLQPNAKNPISIAYFVLEISQFLSLAEALPCPTCGKSIMMSQAYFIFKSYVFLYNLIRFFFKSPTTISTIISEMTQ